jgi:hypothetical protein
MGCSRFKATHPCTVDGRGDIETECLTRVYVKSEVLNPKISDDLCERFCKKTGRIDRFPWCTLLACLLILRSHMQYMHCMCFKHLPGRSAVPVSLGLPVFPRLLV